MDKVNLKDIKDKLQDMLEENPASFNSLVSVLCNGAEVLKVLKNVYHPYEPYFMVEGDGAVSIMTMDDICKSIYWSQMVISILKENFNIELEQ